MSSQIFVIQLTKKPHPPILLVSSDRWMVILFVTGRLVPVFKLTLLFVPVSLLEARFFF